MAKSLDRKKNQPLAKVLSFLFDIIMYYKSMVIYINSTYSTSLLVSEGHAQAHPNSLHKLKMHKSKLIVH